MREFMGLYDDVAGYLKWIRFELNGGDVRGMEATFVKLESLFSSLLSYDCDAINTVMAETRDCLAGVDAWLDGRDWFGKGDRDEDFGDLVLGVRDLLLDLLDDDTEDDGA